MAMTFSQILAGLLEALGLIRFDAASQPCFSAELLCGHLSISSDFPAFDGRRAAVLYNPMPSRASSTAPGCEFRLWPDLVLPGPISVWPVIQTQSETGLHSSPECVSRSAYRPNVWLPSRDLYTRMSPESAFFAHFFRVFVITQTHKTRMAEMICRSPVRELYLCNELRFHPAILLHRVRG